MRSPGVVLRVSRMTAGVPAMASTNRRVSVATAERRWRKLSATRSAVRMDRTGPEISRTVCPGMTAWPEGVTIRTAREPGPRAGRPPPPFPPRRRWRAPWQKCGRTREIRQGKVAAGEIALADVFRKGGSDGVVAQRDMQDGAELIGRSLAESVGRLPGQAALR